MIRYIVLVFLFYAFQFPSFAFCPGDSTSIISSPVSHPIYLTGTFGELRSGHFHTGIDIKSSKGLVGDKLLSVESGYISRIKVQSGGYGKTLYINHPNGYTSVYAHIDQFAPAIRKFVKEKQYQLESFEIDIDIDQNLFQLEKEDFIGTMGMSGRASGPHLHFELRETATEIPVNPLSFGLKLADTRNPVIKNIRLYAKSILGLTHNISFFSTKNKRMKSVISPGDYIICDKSKIAFGAEVYDLMNGLANKNGAYQLILKVNDKIYFDAQFDKVSFTEFRKLNGFIDYPYRQANRKMISRFHKLPGLSLELFQEMKEDGFVKLDTSFSHVELIAYDFSGNYTTKEFWIKHDPSKLSETPPSPFFHAHLEYGNEHFINADWMQLWVPKGILYEDLYLMYSLSDEVKNGENKKIFNIHHEEQAIGGEFELALKSDLTNTHSRDKLCIVQCDKTGKQTSYGGTVQESFIKTWIKSLGSFYVDIDTIPPKITPLKWTKNWSGKQKIAFKISDNFETKGRAKELRYSAYIDYQWILFEYDKKSDTIFYYFDEYLTEGSHKFKLTVEDDRGNYNNFVSEITYQ